MRKSLKSAASGWVLGSLVYWLGSFCGAATIIAAGYTMELTSGGDRVAYLQPGNRLTLEVSLEASELESHNSVVFQLVFSEPGLSLESYEWSAPYQTGGTDDDSTPALSGLPTAIDGESFTGDGAPSEQVDVQFGNAIFPHPGQAARFGRGVLLRMNILLPENYQGPDVISIRADPDTVADGFRMIPALGGHPFEIRIVPRFVGDEAGDSDGDGIPNLVAYALNLETVPGQPPPLMTETSPGLPLFASETREDGEAVFRFTFRKDTSKADIQYEIQASDDLIVWTAVADEVTGRDGASEIRSAQIAMLGQKQFIRLAVSKR